jgi:geranylgeranyl transferase type-2 subunit alpha
VGLLKNELKLTMAYLQIHPKVYWIWNHRKWCLEHVPLGPAANDELEAGEPEGESGPIDGQDKGTTEGWRCGFWKGELAVIEALLDADSRNCMSPPTSPPSSLSSHSSLSDTY